MKDIDIRVIVIWIIANIIFFGLIILAGVAWINNSPGGYKYTIDVQGLDMFTSGLVTDIIVPIPYRNGQQEISDLDLQYKTFGDWKSMLVVTPYGKMLAFEKLGENLTDIHAEFYTSYSDGITIENITEDSFSPVLLYTPSPYTQWITLKDPTHDYSTIIYVPASVQPLQSEFGEIHLNLELDAFEGMQHSMVGKGYRVVIKEVIPPDARNWTTVVAQVGALG